MGELQEEAERIAEETGLTKEDVLRAYTKNPLVHVMINQELENESED